MGEAGEIVVGKRSGAHMPENGFAGRRLFRAGFESPRLRRSRRLGKYGANFSGGVQYLCFAKKFDRVGFQNGIALPETGVAGIDGTPRLRIALHGVRGDVGRDLSEPQCVSIRRKVRRADAAFGADVTACSGEENARSLCLGSRVTSDGVPCQSRRLPGVEERGVIRLRVALRFSALRHLANPFVTSRRRQEARRLRSWPWRSGVGGRPGRAPFERCRWHPAAWACPLLQTPTAACRPLTSCV